MNRWHVFSRIEWLVILSLGLVLYVLIGAMLLIPSHAQNDQWSLPVNISDTPNGSWFPEMNCFSPCN